MTLRRVGFWGLVVFAGVPCVALWGQQAAAVTAGAAVPGVAESMPPERPCTAEQVRELATLTGSDALAHQLMVQMLKGMKVTANPVIPPAMWDEMAVEFGKADLLAGVIPAYQRYLSREDMEAVLAFYRSGPGRRILAAQPYIQSASQAAGKKLGETIGLNAAMHHKDEIEARQKELDKQAAARAGGIQLNVAPTPSMPEPESVSPASRVEPK